MNRSPDPRTVVVSFRMTPAERALLDRKKGKKSIADYLRGLVFGDDA